MSTKLFVLPSVLVIFACCWSAPSEDCRLTPDGTCVAVASSVLQISSRNGGALGQLQHNTSMTQASEESAPYQFDQTGIAGSREIWNVGGARGRGVSACFQAVQADSRCAKDYFTYVTRGDRNCGCKGNKGPLNVRGDRNGDIYRIGFATTAAPTTQAPTTLPPTTQAPTTILPTTQAPTISPTTATTTSNGDVFFWPQNFSEMPS